MSTATVDDTDCTVSVWIDHTGTVHERAPENFRRTLCGRNAGAENDVEVHGPRVCGSCVRLHVAVEVYGAITG